MELNQNRGTTGSSSVPALSLPPREGHLQQFMTSAAFQGVLRHILEAPGSSRERLWREIIHQHFHYGLLLQRGVLGRGCTHLPQVRKEGGRPILLGSGFPWDLIQGLTQGSASGSTETAGKLSGQVPVCPKGCLTPALDASRHFFSSTAGIRSRDDPFVFFVRFFWVVVFFPPSLT